MTWLPIDIEVGADIFQQKVAQKLPSELWVEYMTNYGGDFIDESGATSETRTLNLLITNQVDPILHWLAMARILSDL